MQLNSLPSTTLVNSSYEAARNELARLGFCDAAVSEQIIANILKPLSQNQSYQAIEYALSVGIGLDDAYLVIAHLLA